MKRSLLSAFMIASLTGHNLAPDLPDDPMLAEQWYLFPAGHKNGHPGGIDAIGAWPHVRAARPVVVAVFDAGVNLKHPDLKANLWTNPGERPNGVDDDGNGYVDDLHGWNFVGANNRPTSRPEPKFPDQFDHGTAVASLIAAVPENGIGIAGVGRNVKIMSLRVVGPPDAQGGPHFPASSTFPEAIRYAIRNGARVLVCTTPLIAATPFDRVLTAPLREAEDAGLLIVRSAGNAGRSVDEMEEYRALTRFSNVLIVGGTLRDGSLSPRMNFGNRVKIAAPCVDIVFASFDGYARHPGPGTSFAAPIVAAVAATLFSQSPELTPAQVISRLRAASIALPESKNTIDGGRLDMAKVFAP